METIAANITDILHNWAPYVHFISFGLLFLAGFNLPIFEDLVVIVSASIAATIVPENTVYIIIGCFLGAYVSDIIAYYIGRIAGNRLFTTKFFKKTVSEDRMYKIKYYFDNYGNRTLFIGRFIPFGVRNVMFMTAGLIKMPIGKFMLVDVSALLITLSIQFSLGYSFGKNYEQIMPYLDKYKLIIFLVFVCVALFFILRHKLRKK